MAGSGSREALIRQLAQKYNLDPNAVVAIGSVEGRRALLGGNSIGDNGTSFGPFQLHAGGALPASVWAHGPAYANKWANSPQGINYAESRMASAGAAGLQGKAAVQTISSKFERPADVPGEVSKALGFYGGQGGRALAAASPMTVGGSAQGPLAGPNNKMAMVASLLDQASAAANGQPLDPNGLAQIVALKQQAQAAQSQYGSGATGALAEPSTGTSSVGLKAVQAGAGMKGTPYVWGGNTTGKALDCSGFTQQAYARAGIKLPRTSQDQFRTGTPVKLNQLQPGDLVFTEPGQSGPNHVGMYVGHGQVQQSPHTGTVNGLIPLNSFVSGGLVGARRYTP